MATRECCDALGWEYVVWSEPDPAPLFNIRFLGGFRRAPVHLDRIAPLLLEACRVSPRRVRDLASLGNEPYFTRPVLFHLIWARMLHIDLTLPLREHTLVSATPEVIHAT